MSDVPDDPPGPILPFTVGGDLFDFADDYRGDTSAFELSADEEAYRSQAYAAVLHYAGDYGMEIFPVWRVVNGACACRDGSSCPSAGKHPVDLRWPEAATSDPERAARWWRPLDAARDQCRPTGARWPASGPGWAAVTSSSTSTPTRVSAVTSRSPALIAEHDGEYLPDTLAYQTGGGGRQHIMLVPPGIEVRSSASKLGDNLDIKGMNGYGILPPSRSGKGQYRCSPTSPPTCRRPPGWRTGSASSTASAPSASAAPPPPWAGRCARSPGTG